MSSKARRENRHVLWACWAMAACSVMVKLSFVVLFLN